MIDHKHAFTLRLPPYLAGRLTALAAADGKSLNEWINERLSAAVGTTDDCSARAAILDEK